MFSSGNCASVPLVASLNGSGNGGGNGGNGNGLFDNGAWIIIILFLFVFLGWGNNFGGNGNNGNNGGGNAMPTYIPIPTNVGGSCDSDVQRGFNQQAVVTKLDGITQGICDSTYALNSSLQSGFAGVNQSLCQGFNGVNTAMLQGFNSTNVALMQGQNALQAQAADCCCKNQIGQMQLGNSMERGFCDTNYNAATNTTAIIQNAHNDTDRVLAKLDAMENARKDEKIAEQAQQITALQFAASQAQQNAFITANQDAQTAELIRRLGADCPQPAYVVQPPQPVTFPTNCCGTANYASGYGNGCGCNSGCGCA